jgi:hypothetical protein
MRGELVETPGNGTVTQLGAGGAERKSASSGKSQLPKTEETPNAKPNSQGRAVEVIEGRDIRGTPKQEKGADPGGTKPAPFVVVNEIEHRNTVDVS